MNEIKYCRKCGDELTDNNWNISQQKIYNYICKDCSSKYMKKWHKKNYNDNIIKERKRARESYYLHHDGKPMDENPECSSYLGIIIAERILSYIFKNTIQMPNNNRGFDFICNKEFKIDAKASCRRKSKNRNDKWQFVINHNIIADYFICLGFDDRKNLNPEHIWLIPGKDINHLSSLIITETRLEKWDQYEKIDKLEELKYCCNTMKGGEI